MRRLKIRSVDYWTGVAPDAFFGKDKLGDKYEFVASEKPEFLFYSCFGTEYLRYEDCIRIFYTGENIRPDFNQCDYAIGFDRMEFGDRYLRKPIFAKKPPLKPGVNYAGRKFCNFIYSNANVGEGAKVRVVFCKLLANYRRVDCPGPVLNNMQGDIEPRHKEWTVSKCRFIANYKFTIAWENSFYPGYTTEKLLHPFGAGSVPIYMGDPDVTLDFNPESFVNCRDFKNWQECVDYIIYLDTHDDAYMRMLAAPAMRDSYHPPDLAAFLTNIFENGRRYNDDVMASLHSAAHHRQEDIFNMLFSKVMGPAAEKSGIDAASFRERLLYGPRNLGGNNTKYELESLLDKVVVCPSVCGNK